MASDRERYPVLTVGAAYAFATLGIGESAGYRSVQKGDFPIPAIKVGGQYRFSRAALAELLGMSVTDLPAPEVHDDPRDNENV